ncbi:MAG: cation:proton antiporter [Actinomycetota bacterium]
MTVVAAVFILYSLAASRLDRVSVSGPLVFVAAGVLVGPAASDGLPSALGGESGKLLAELTLAILLFADASTVRLRDVLSDALLPARLLLFGLPLTLVLGTLAAKLLFPSEGWAMAALIASILAPTDAALGLAVVTNRAVPVRIRRALNVESGLNDGIATPFVTLFLLVVAAEEAVGGGDWASEALKELGLAIVVAIVVGIAGGFAVTAARNRSWTSPLSEQLAVLSLALLPYSAAVTIGGNGFVAAFVGGILFGAATGGRLAEQTEFTENLALFASFMVWTLFGAFLVGPEIRDGIDGNAIVYALISLTVVRMIPVAVSLWGLRLRFETLAFAGWFGPRGLASVVFLLIAAEDLHGQPSTATLTAAVTFTVLFSVVLHGLTAGPLASSYGRRIEAAGEGIPELAVAPEPRVRRRGLSHRSGQSDRPTPGFEHHPS